MVSYSAARKMKSFKMKVGLLSLGMILGLTYDAFAQADTSTTGEKVVVPATGATVTTTPAPVAGETVTTTAPATTSTTTTTTVPATTVVASPAEVKSVPSENADKKAGAPAKTASSDVPAKFVKRHITIERHTAELVKLDKGITEIFVSNPEVADVSINSPGVAYVYGKKPGVTSIYANSKDGKTTLNLDVQVTYNVGSLKNAINKSYPNEDITVVSTPAGIILEGAVTGTRVSRDIVNMATRYLGENDTVLNNMEISSPTQVYIQVKVAEVNRTVLKQLDISLGAQAKIGTVTFGLITGARDALNSFGFAPVVPGVIDRIGSFARAAGPPPLNSLGIRGIDGSHFSIVGLLDALNQEGLATVLAEPNLMALSGETAKVLLGGEFPFPVPQAQNVTIDFKQFGISLDFTPTILSGNQINLRVRPEVSELDFANALRTSLPNGESATVPSLKVRRAETSVEMGSGESMAIAGLLARTTQASINDFPGLADIPVLGALFRSTRFQRNETELVIIVTPFLVSPVKKRDLASPLDNLRSATHLGMILGQRLNRVVTNPRECQKFVMTQNIAATGDMGSANATVFEQPLASSGESLIPTNDQARGEDNMTSNRPEDLGQNLEANLVGDAGFYTE